ncbi:MAG: hypothetical protein R2695_15430 [Acidimicrobiales bacterium]
MTAEAFADPEIGVVACRVENTNARRSVDHGGYGELRRRELMRSTLVDAGSLPWWPGMSVVRRSAAARSPA